MTRLVSPLEFKFSVTKLYPAISTLDLTCYPLLLLFFQCILVTLGFSKVQSDFFCNPFSHTCFFFQRGISINLYLFVFVDTFIIKGTSNINRFQIKTFPKIACYKDCLFCPPLAWITYILRKEALWSS